MNVNGKACVIGDISFQSMKEIERIPLEGVFHPADRDPPDVNRLYTYTHTQIHLTLNLCTHYACIYNSCAAFEFDMMTDLDIARVALIYR